MEMKAYIMDENRQLVVREMPEPHATENNAIYFKSNCKALKMK